MRTTLKILRFIAALPVAAPMILIGMLVGMAFPPARYLGILGLWLLGIEVAQ
jgi:hypothetical protein